MPDPFYGYRDKGIPTILFQTSEGIGDLRASCHHAGTYCAFTPWIPEVERDGILQRQSDGEAGVGVEEAA